MHTYQLVKAGFRSFRIGIPFRIGLAFFSVLASVGFALFVLGGQHGAAHAAPALSEISLSGSDAWGLAFDNRGSVWVAEPGCDPNPACGIPPTGKIQQVDRNTFTVINTFTEPAGFASPVFLATDASGNIWFSEQNNSIGELIPNLTNAGASTWKQWALPTPSADPYDLAFDHNGNLWFTEILANNIGEFTPSTQTFSETPTPSANSKPYGIVGPDPTTGAMWFTENNTAVARIASFIPPATGALITSSIKEYLTNSGSGSATPHRITFDGNGNIWWTEGPDRDIGELVINSAQPGTANGVTEFTVPYPASTCPGSGSCTMHISGIGADSAGNIWFDDSQSARIGYFTPGTKTFTMLPFLGGSVTSNVHPHDGLAVDSNNNVFVAEEFANKLAKVTTGIPPGAPGGTATPGTPGATPPPSTVPAGPVNTIWYFGEGRVGKGFREYLTIDNPGKNVCALNIQYNYTYDSGASGNKTVSVQVPPATRLTESANNDLSIADSSTNAATLAAEVNVTNTSSCTGVVAERPMYFSNFHGSVSSGTDVPGGTHLSNTYYFADVPSGGGYSSYLTILNPNTSKANVVVTYYANGGQVGTQSVTVNASARGTIGVTGLPTHVAAVVSSSVPVMVERPTYFAGAVVNGTSISGAYDIVGVSSLSNDLLFAEGYTSATTQEYLTISNVDPANKAATVTITLKSKTGTTNNYTLSLGARSQTIWNVNANNTFAGSSPEVSIEVKSSGANIVAQREMYFTYKHTLQSTGVTTQANGGTDVIGQVGPATHTSYSFAEGYTNRGYNEWLTIQNPTATTETIYLTLVNQSGQVYNTNFQVAANSRFTADITNTVQLAFHPGTNSSLNSVSMTVQTLNGAVFVAERPMYWNTGGSTFVTQGGNDILGYVGG